MLTDEHLSITSDYLKMQRVSKFFFFFLGDGLKGNMIKA